MKCLAITMNEINTKKSRITSGVVRVNVWMTLHCIHVTTFVSPTHDIANLKHA